MLQFVTPSLQYFADCKANSIGEPLACFKAARLFSPTKIEEMKPSTSEVDTLAAFPFLFDGLNALKTELPAYLAAVEDISPDYNPSEFWKRHKETLPFWAAALCKILLVQPSSAASKRVFSTLKTILW